MTVNCTECTNAVISPSQGVYCRLFNEVVDPDFAKECPGWQPA